MPSPDTSSDPISSASRRGALLRMALRTVMTALLPAAGLAAILIAVQALSLSTDHLDVDPLPRPEQFEDPAPARHGSAGELGVARST